jgi:hypothetical protein
MRKSLMSGAIGFLLVLAWGASAQNAARELLNQHQAQAQQPRQHRGTMSPFYNVHHRDVPSYDRGGITTHVESRPGGGHLIYNSGMVISHRPPTHRPGYCWVPAHYEWVTRRLWIPGRWEEEYIPPVYERRFVNGNEVVVMVREGYYEQYWVEGYYEHIRERVWVAGYWRPA